MESIAEPAIVGDTRVMVIWIAFVVAYVTLVVVRLIASRRLRAQQASTVWLFFTPQFFGPAGFLLGGVSLLRTNAVLGLVLALVGLGYGAIVVRMVRRIARAAASATTSEELATAAVEPTVDYMLTMTVLSVMGLIVVGVVAIIWAVASR